MFDQQYILGTDGSYKVVRNMPVVKTLQKDFLMRHSLSGIVAVT